VTVGGQANAASSLGRLQDGEVEPAQSFQQAFHDRQVHAADYGGVLGGEGEEFWRWHVLIENG
jgi:hypothetical protein